MFDNEKVSALMEERTRAENELESAKARTRLAKKQLRGHRIHLTLATGVGVLLMVLFGFKAIGLLAVIVFVTGAYLLAVITRFNSNDGSIRVSKAATEEIEADLKVKQIKSRLNETLFG